MHEPRIDQTGLARYPMSGRANSLDCLDCLYRYQSVILKLDTVDDQVFIKLCPMNKAKLGGPLERRAA